MSEVNPAEHPWRPWMSDSQHVDFEARALIRRLTTQQRAVLALLATHGAQGISATDVAQQSKADEGDIVAVVERVNTLAEALGRQPMILQAGDQLSVASYSIPVIQQGMRDAK